jgi:phospholipid N-methyltransferase
MLALLSLSPTLIPSTRGYECARTAPFHPSIHNLGNTGVLGRLHAEWAERVTRLIDKSAYSGRNMRSEVAEGMASVCSGELIEIGCGVGTLTRELVKTGAFRVSAMDTSVEMINEARRTVPGAAFWVENGADVLKHTANVVVMCMVLHELPKAAHDEILGSMLLAATEEVWLVDIDPSYQPSSPMLAGEPYVPSYLKEIEGTIAGCAEAHGKKMDTFEIIPGHVRGWVLSRPPSA